MRKGSSTQIPDALSSGGVQLPAHKVFVLWTASRLALGICVALLTPNAVAEAAVCADVRDTIIKEYVTKQTDFVPACLDFSIDAHSSSFTFNQLNSGDFSWAILRSALLNGIEDVKRTFGGPLQVNSGYRNPVHNEKIGGASNSRHVHGDAVDFQTIETTWTRLRTAGKTAGACAEPFQMSGYGHVHLDWRGTCPSSW